MSAEALGAPPDVGTLLWEADRIHEADLEPDQRRWFENVVAYLDRVWPDDPEGVELEPEEKDELLTLRNMEHVVSNVFGTWGAGELDAKIREKLAAERAEGEKDATVPSRASTAERKAMRLLLERRLVVTRRETTGELAGLVVATCRGENGSYDLGYDPRGQGRWRCTCPELQGGCSHLTALKMVV